MPKQPLLPLTRNEFDEHIKNGTLRLSFVGMSNAGKSYRSRRLHEDLEFHWYHIDEQIMNALGFSNMQEISSWLGLPYAPQYKEHEEKYLELENELTKSAALDEPGDNLVFDTTGSVIHLGEGAIAALHEHSLIVHLDVGDDSLDMMMERFKKEPKPVAWAGYFSKRDGESDEDALVRSYGELLPARLQKYRQLAHLNIRASEVHDLSAVETLRAIRNRLT